MRTPKWAVKGQFDRYGNITCATCGNVQSDSFPVCIKCCKHRRLKFDEKWHGNDESGGWGITCKCVKCGIEVSDIGTLDRKYTIELNVSVNQNKGDV